MDVPVDWPATDLLGRAEGRWPDRPALVDADGGATWSVRALSTGPVEAAATALASAGLGPGDHLGVVVPPGPRVAVLLHAAARVGAVLVPLDPDAPASALGARCDVADVDRVVAAPGAADAASAAAGAPVHDVEAVVSLRGASEAADPGEAAASVDPHRWAPDDVQWLVFTSGTTGEPRAVALTARNLLASASASAARLGVEPDDRWLACLPTHHVGGLAPFVRTALDGTTAVVQSAFDPGRTAAAMRDRNVTGVSLVPTMLRRLLDAGWTPPDGLRFVLVGGAPTPPALVDRCEAAGVPVHPTYGMTETASQVATATPAEAFANRGTVGRPLDGTEVRVLDDDGEPLPPGEPGALVVDGPTVAAGYRGAPAATADRFRLDGFHTRDRGYRDEGGRLWVLGRLDDAVQTGGETVHPDRVAAALREHPTVGEAAVVGLPDPDWGEVVAALVVPAGGSRRRGDAVDVDALREHCRERLAPAAVPKVLAPVDALPRTASGTVDRDAVRDRLEAARSRDGV